MVSSTFADLQHGQESAEDEEKTNRGRRGETVDMPRKSENESKRGCRTSEGEKSLTFLSI